MRIEQGYKYEGDDYWKWWVWLEGADDELDSVDSVDYILHHTFPNPKRTVKDRSTKFKLETSGWGVFRLHVIVHPKGGGPPIKLTHDLELRYPDGKRTYS